jgi:DNA-binding beta-propeller fold protein YncE
MRWLLLVVALLGRLVLSAPAEAQDEIFVANTANFITVYNRTANGDVAPVRVLGGSATGLVTPDSVAVDLVHNELFVANAGASSVTVYDRAASGNTPPLRTIQGPATGLGNPEKLALDLANGEVFVANANPPSNNYSVTVYSRTANGNVAPLRILQGPATGLSLPYGFVVDTVHNELFVVNFGGSVTVFSRTASGNSAPLRTIQGAATGLNGPRGVALDLLRDELFVVDGIDAGSIKVFSRSASGNVPPLRSISGPATGLAPIMNDLALDLAANELLMPYLPLAGGTGSIIVHSRTASGNAAPLRKIEGAATSLGRPAGVAVTPKLALLAAVNNNTFHSGRQLNETGGLHNPGLGGSIDLFVGNLLPNGTIVFITPGGAGFGTASNPASFLPLATALPLTAPFSAVAPNFVSYQWTGAEPSGDFLFFVLALRAGALSSGVVTLADVIGFGSAPFTFTP